jgi:NADPH-dependent ferric siderophore reductase
VVTARARTYDAVVADRVQVSPHLVRLTLTGLPGFESTGIPDEWVGLVVPGQFQSRYYTVRHVEPGRMVLDVVVHEVGLVTEWAKRDCVGDAVTLTEPKGSFDPPAGAAWLMLVGDLTAMPAMARIAEQAQVPTTFPATCRTGPRSRGWSPPPQAPARWPRSSRASTGPRATATSGWRGSPRRCGPSAST